MGYKRKYTKSSEGAIASYDFTELVSGLGYERYYAVASDQEALGTQTYMLTNNSSIYTDASSISTSQTSQAAKTLNFDSSAFRIPRIVDGTAFVNFAFVNNDADVTNVTFSAQLFKVHSDGTTTTALSSAKVVDYDSNTPPGTALGANVKNNALLFLALTRTKITIGEKIRLQIIIDLKDTGDNVTVYHDPLGRDFLSDTNYSTQMKVDIPFEIELS